MVETIVGDGSVGGCARLLGEPHDSFIGILGNSGFKVGKYGDGSFDWVEIGGDGMYFLMDGEVECS